VYGLDIQSILLAFSNVAGTEMYDVVIVAVFIWGYTCRLKKQTLFYRQGVDDSASISSKIRSVELGIGKLAKLFASHTNARTPLHFWLN
jgi:hypothetical protein